MHLKTLTVRGFKSFASATSFEFEPGVTAVVGPNGSGKSNVVDALAWVMGEQGAKSLRGGKMEDVIFAGTSGRAALGRAQVSLTIDNSDGVLPIEYSEVTISRTLFRTGGSEYAINGSSCRLLDIQELLSDSGLGREMHVIVGQGQLDRILHATPEERRGFIEEAAGVLKHRRRKEKTLRKLASMEQNLSRLEDLTGEIGKQLTPLGRQAKVARRAQKIQLEVRDARARLFADDWVQASTAIETDAEELERLQRGLREAEATHEQTTERIAALEADAARLAPEVSRTRDTWYSLGQLKERYASLAQLAQERQRAVAAPVGRAHLRDPEELQQAADRRAQELVEAETGLGEKQDAHREASAARTEAEDAARAEQEHHAALLAAAATRRENIASLRGTMATKKSQLESLQVRRQEQEQRIEAVRTRLARHEQELAELEGASGPTEADHQVAAEASESTHRAQEQAQAELDRTSADRSRAQRDLDAARARVSALEDSLPAADATDAVARRFEGRVRRVREDLGVEPQWAAAVATALGPVADGLALEDPALVPEILQTAQEKELGVVHLLLDAQEPAATAPDAGARARALVEHESAPELHWAPSAVTGGKLAQSVRAVLRDTLLAADSVAATAWWAGQAEELRSGLRIACTDGTLLTPTSARGGSADAVSGLEVAARVEQAREALADLETMYQQADNAHRQAQDRHRTAKQAAQEARAEFSRISSESTASASKLARARTLVSSAQEELEQALAQEQELTAQEPAAEEALKQAVAAVSAALELQDQDGGQALDAAEQAKDAAQEQARAARTAETEALLAVRAAQSEIEKLQQRRDAAQRAVASERAAHAQADREEAQRRAQYASVSRTLDMVGTVAERVERSLAQAHAEREEAQTRRAAVETQLGTAREQEKEQRTALDTLRAKTHSGELERATREARLENLREQILEELSLTAEALVEDFGPHLMVPEYDENGDPWRETPFVREVQEKRLNRARKDLKALGKVNPLALEEFAALEERHTYLVQQLEDLKSSRDDLQQIIRDVDEHVREVFAQAFEDTQREFLEVFRILFPGGEGKLVLTEPGDLLNTGIEVHAKPAGKKVKRLSLLSGGERSLTAIAMLVAIFKARPSPFYVMDEVEAALDDRNLGRLLTILKQLQETSQLIIITHQKRTMEIADALYGVSMRGDGITQVISQRLADLT